MVLSALTVFTGASGFAVSYFIQDEYFEGLLGVSATALSTLVSLTTLTSKSRLWYAHDNYLHHLPEDVQHDLGIAINLGIFPVVGSLLTTLGGWLYLGWYYHAGKNSHYKRFRQELPTTGN